MGYMKLINSKSIEQMGLVDQQEILSKKKVGNVMARNRISTISIASVLNTISQGIW